MNVRRIGADPPRAIPTLASISRVGPCGAKARMLPQKNGAVGVNRDVPEPRCPGSVETSTTDGRVVDLEPPALSFPMNSLGPVPGRPVRSRPDGFHDSSLYHAESDEELRTL